jgi:hypothetical protein
MAGRRTGRLVVLIVLSGLLSPVSSARAAGAAAGDAAYTVICNGDSNTQALAFVSVQENWCELVGEQPGVVTINRGVGRRRFRRAGADVFVATVPPIFRRDGTPSGDDAVIRELNDRIRRAFPGGYVEFYEGMTYPDDYSDSTHMNAHGHAKRAAAVLRRLLDEAPASPASPPRR